MARTKDKGPQFHLETIFDFVGIDQVIAKLLSMAKKNDQAMKTYLKWITVDDLINNLDPDKLSELKKLLK